MYRKFFCISLVTSLLVNTMSTNVFAMDGKETSAENYFSDVSKKHWCYETIDEFFKNGAIKGYDMGNKHLFKPDELITRAEFASVLSRYLNIEALSENFNITFKDVSDNSWFNDSVNLIASKGIVKGYPDNTFRPSATIKRNEITAMSASFVRMNDESVAITYDKCFPDVEKGDWFFDDVAQLKEKNIAYGYPDGYFKPERRATRAEAIRLLYNLKKRIEATVSPTPTATPTSTPTSSPTNTPVSITYNPPSVPSKIHKIYTVDKDFDEGTRLNIQDGIDQLEIDNTKSNMNFIWVAVSTKGTVVKINTDTGKVMGEYRTAPNNQPLNPSRTTVDLNGSVWVANRDGNSVTRIGLAENGQWIDKNGNGICDTSTGLDDIKPWTNAAGADTNGGVSTAEDECIINYVRVSSSGTRHVSVDSNNDVWVSGTGSRAFDLIDGITGKIKRSEPSVNYGGYGGLIDKNGVIWSAAPFLRWDTKNPLTGPNGVNWTGQEHDSYGMGIDKYGNVWNTGYYQGQVRKFAPDGTLLGTYPYGAPHAKGVVADANGDIWVAHTASNTVGHLKNDGTFVGNVTVGNAPSGVAVDAKGKIWATNHNDGTCSRIDPTKGEIGADGKTPIGLEDLKTEYLGGNLYNYSDMTGSTLTGAPTFGTWSTVFDSKTQSTKWGVIGWKGQIYNDGEVKVFVSSADDLEKEFSQPIQVNNMNSFDIPDGRYIKIEVRMKRSSDGISPVIYDLTVGEKAYSLSTKSNQKPIIKMNSSYTINEKETLILEGKVNDDLCPEGSIKSFLWEKLSGPGQIEFSSNNSYKTKLSFSEPGKYTVRLTVNDGSLTTTFDTSIYVNALNTPTPIPTPTATVEPTPTATVAPTATAEPTPTATAEPTPTATPTVTAEPIVASTPLPTTN